MCTVIVYACTSSEACFLFLLFGKPHLGFEDKLYSLHCIIALSTELLLVQHITSLMASAHVFLSQSLDTKMFCVDDIIQITRVQSAFQSCFRTDQRASCTDLDCALCGEVSAYMQCFIKHRQQSLLADIASRAHLVNTALLMHVW